MKERLTGAGIVVLSDYAMRSQVLLTNTPLPGVMLTVRPFAREGDPRDYLLDLEDARVVRDMLNQWIENRERELERWELPYDPDPGD